MGEAWPLLPAVDATRNSSREIGQIVGVTSTIIEADESMLRAGERALPARSNSAAAA
jgi:hypothetical protein